MIGVFLLVRDEDETGVSGTGVVAAGMEFPDGHVIMRWLVGEHKSSVTWESMHAVEKIHGHNGKTRIVRVGKLNPMAPDPKLNVRDAYQAHIKSYGNLIFGNEKRKAQFKGLEELTKSPHFGKPCNRFTFEEMNHWDNTNWWRKGGKPAEPKSGFASTSTKPLTLEWLNDYCKKIAIESAKQMEKEVIWGKRMFGDLSTAKKETRIPVVSSLSPT